MSTIEKLSFTAQGFGELRPRTRLTRIAAGIISMELTRATERHRDTVGPQPNPIPENVGSISTNSDGTCRSTPATPFDDHPRVVRLRSLITAASKRAAAYAHVKTARARLLDELQRIRAELETARQAADDAAMADVLGDGSGLKHTAAALAQIGQLETQIQAAVFVLKSLNALEISGSRAAACAERWRAALQDFINTMSTAQQAHGEPCKTPPLPA